MIARAAYDMNGCKFPCHDWKVFRDLKRRTNKGGILWDFYVVLYTNGALVWKEDQTEADFVPKKEVGDMRYCGATAMRAVRARLAWK